MTGEIKTLVTEEGTFDLSSYKWDDNLFSDLLTREKHIHADQAMDISKSLREEIQKMELHTITIPLLENIIEAKLREFGFTKISPIKLNSSMFKNEEPVLSENAKKVLERRYLKKDDSGKVKETPAQMFRRVARHIANAESKYGDEDHVKEIEERFYQMMIEFKFLPNSPTLMNAGRRLGQLAACFVLPVEDSMEGIFDALKNAALIHKSGGGTGFSFSRLRPKNSRVGTTGGVASGPISFMKIFNTATEQVKQGGTRRGANMAMLRVDHPDIMEFINSKKRNKELRL
jgi:ribonucleoside-diphosphate reductase alpha chain